jgi:hypothetical protein
MSCPRSAPRSNRRRPSPPSHSGRLPCPTSLSSGRRRETRSALEGCHLDDLTPRWADLDLAGRARCAVSWFDATRWSSRLSLILVTRPLGYETLTTSIHGAIWCGSSSALRVRALLVSSLPPFERLPRRPLRRGPGRTFLSWASRSSTASRVTPTVLLWAKSPRPRERYHERLPRARTALVTESVSDLELHGEDASSAR